jgi:hypothetical protein
MLIKCIKNNIYDVGESITLLQYLKESVHLDNNELPLSIGKIYHVYGCLYKKEYPWFYICEDDDFEDYPKAYAAPFFEVIDSSLSKYWVFGHAVIKNDINSEGYIYTHMTFKEWANDYFFYERLVEGQEKEVSIFMKYKRLIDAENR